MNKKITMHPNNKILAIAFLVIISTFQLAAEKKIKLVIPLCVPLLVSSVQKIDNVAIAAELRGFHLRNKNSCYKLTKFEIRDYSTLLLGVFVVVLAFYL